MGQLSNQQKIRGALLGTVVGDALGLPAEGLSRRRIGKLFPGRWHHRFLLHYGMVSDDTDHTIYVAQSLLAHPDSEKLFQRRLAKCLSVWLFTVPAGIGSATLRSIIKLWLGINANKSGVYSAGNGAAMRVAPIGLLFAQHPTKMNLYLNAATVITHSDRRALIGAKAVASIVAWIMCNKSSMRISEAEILEILNSCGKDDQEWLNIVDRMASGIKQNISVQQMAVQLGQEKGISGYVYHTVPMAIYGWYRHFGSFEETLTNLLNCGGDTDTVAAIAGALAGASVGEEGIPQDWLEPIFDWPRGIDFYRRLADQLTIAYEGGGPFAPLSYFWPGLMVRGILLFLVVIAHVMRRLLPPY